MDASVVTSLKNYQKKVLKSISDAIIDTVSPFRKIKELNEIPTMKELKNILSKYPISSLLPYESYDKIHQVYYNKDSIGFMLIAQPSTGLALNELKILNGIFSQGHKTNTCIQVSMVSDTNTEHLFEEWRKLKTNQKGELSSFSDFMAKNRIKHFKKAKWKSLFKDQNFLVKDLKLIISYTIPLENYSLVEDINFLERSKLGVIGTLKSAGIYSNNLDPENFINIMSSILNPNDGEPPYLTYDPENLISRQIVDSDTAFLIGSGSSSLIHKGVPYTVIPFHVRQFPREWGGYLNSDLIGSFYNNVLRIGCPFICTLTVNVPDQFSTKAMAKSKHLRATQMADSPVAKFTHQWADRKRDWDYTSKRMENGDKLLKAFYQVILITPQEQEEECSQSLISLYDSMGWILSKSRFTPLHAFLGALPMGLCKEGHKFLDISGHYKSRLSWSCVNLAPWIGEWKGTGTPLMLLFGRRGQTVLFSHFDNKKGNYNIACAATSGSGKSFFAQELIFSIIGMNGRVFTIDAGGSYKELCQMIGGSYIDFGEGQPILNPFSKLFSEEAEKAIEDLSRKNSDYDKKDYINDFMPMLVGLLSLMASPDKELDNIKKVYLQRAIFNAVEKFRGKTTITKVQEECLLLRNEANELIDEAKELSTLLYSYTDKGMYGRYFEGENNINLQNRFVVLELDALNAKGPLQGVVLLILMIQINQVMYLSGNKAQKKQVIIDEAWRLMGNGSAGKFIEEGYRVARKHGGSYMTITQSINDYFNSDTAKAAFTNSDFRIDLRQKPESLKQAEKEGRINNESGQLRILESLETIQGKYSELAITSPDGLAVTRFCVDPVAEKIYSTKSDETEHIRTEQKNGKTLLEAVYSLLKKQGVEYED